MVSVNWKYHPKFSEGQLAFTEGWRRGSNPYSADGSQSDCIAWWAGWDEAQKEEDKVPNAYCEKHNIDHMSDEQCPRCKEEIVFPNKGNNEKT